MKLFNCKLILCLFFFAGILNLKATNHPDDLPVLYTYTVYNPQAIVTPLESAVHITFSDESITLNAANQEAKEYRLNEIDFLSINRQKGDVNFDGVVDISDVVVLVNYVLGIKSPLYIDKFGDLNSNQSINISDVVSLVNLVLGVSYLQ
jgi:hypothetical protein